jgi:DNA modification methylase
MDKLGWGFISNAYKYFVMGENIDSFESRVQKFKKNILSDEAWVKAIAEKAMQNKVPLDTMIMRDARYMAEMEYSNGN